MRLRRYLALDAMGDFLWVTTFVGLGWLAGEPFFRVVGVVMEYAGSAAGFFAAGLALYLAYKLLQRIRFRTQLRVSRLSAGELKRRLDAGDEMVLVDLRHRREVEDGEHAPRCAPHLARGAGPATRGRLPAAATWSSSVVDPTSGRAPGWRSG